MAPPLRLLAPVALSLLAPRALAQPQTTPIVDRNYEADLHLGAAHGSSRMVAMGGVGTATAEGAAGLVVSPGAAALRPLASQDPWDWDVAISTFVPDLGSDFDNNGRASTGTFDASVTSLGLLGYWRSWALGIGGTSVEYRLDPAADGDPPLLLEVSVIRLVLARMFLDGALALGVSTRIGTFELQEQTTSLFEVAGTSLEAGA